jgi:hypothetical protein
MDKFEEFVKENEKVERKDFEHAYSHLKLNRDACGEYVHQVVQYAWEGWLYCAFHKSGGVFP